MGTPGWVDIEEIQREHHRSCYGVNFFMFKWQEINCMGLWAYGGDEKDKKPSLKNVELKTPPKEGGYAWRCYIGPIPEFYK